ncbi:MAG: hypothetical protein ABSF91_05490 [Bacteroidota bacterium]|jgi:hypothetical protein
MNSDNEVLKQAIVRTVVIASLVIVPGLIVFGTSVFNPLLTHFEFVANGITIAIGYAAFKAHRARDGFAALLVWYVLLTLMIFSPIYAWSFIMEASYVIGLTGSVYFYLWVNKRRYANNRVQRMIAAALILGLAHGLIVIFLEAVSLRVLVHPVKTFTWSYMNLRNGTVIGILSAVGMELSDYLVNSFPAHEEVAN